LIATFGFIWYFTRAALPGFNLVTQLEAKNKKAKKAGYHVEAGPKEILPYS